DEGRGPRSPPLGGGAPPPSRRILPPEPAQRQDLCAPRNRQENDMATSVKQLMEAANAAVPRRTPAEASDLIAKSAVVVDVRDGTEVAQTGKVAGAVHISRGLLEFKADPESPGFDKNLARDKPVILYCASGGRSALSGKLLKDMGYEKVYNLGAF